MFFQKIIIYSRDVEVCISPLYIYNVSHRITDKMKSSILYLGNCEIMALSKQSSQLLKKQNKVVWKNK